MARVTLYVENGMVCKAVSDIPNIEVEIFDVDALTRDGRSKIEVESVWNVSTHDLHNLEINHVA